MWWIQSNDFAVAVEMQIWHGSSKGYSKLIKVNDCGWTWPAGSKPAYLMSPPLLKQVSCFKKSRKNEELENGTNLNW